MVAESTANGVWGGLSSLAEPERERAMLERWESVLALSEADQMPALRELVTEEYSLDDPSLDAMTLSRLRTWLAIGGDRAAHLAKGYDAVFNDLPADMAMRRARTVQTMVTRHFQPDEVEQLFVLAPSVMQHVPRDHRVSVEKPVAPPARKKRRFFGLGR